MDTEAVKELPALQHIIEQVRAGQKLQAGHQAELYAKLESHEPVLVALAAWAIGHTDLPREEALERLTRAETTAYTLGLAFVKLARALLSESSPQNVQTRLKEFTTDENPYLRVEAARELVKTDPTVAAHALEKIVTESANPARNEAGRILQTLRPQTPLPFFAPITDDPYDIIGNVLRAGELFTDGKLSAETSQGEVAPPFSITVTKLRFRWRLAEEAATGLEIRWIAADTGGAASPDHVIATASSAAGKTDGEFTLSKPSQGFPPGSYRVELRQKGKVVYTKPFEIKKSE